MAEGTDRQLTVIQICSLGDMEEGLSHAQPEVGRVEYVGAARSSSSSDARHLLLVGVDIGGTFTGISLPIGQGTRAIATGKVLTTPDDPSQGVLDGIGLLTSREKFSLSDVTVRLSTGRRSRPIPSSSGTGHQQHS